MKKSRDNELDIIRGLAMLYIMFIHTIYNNGIFEVGNISILKSFFLFEMPLFFFVTGAATMYEKDESILYFYLKKFQRILIPYYIYSLLVIILNFIFYYLNNHEIYHGVSNWILPFLHKETFSPYFTCALWFITAYLLVIILIPYFKKFYIIKKKQNSKDVFLPLFYILLFFLMKDCGHFNFDVNSTLSLYFNSTICYSFFCYLGFFWKDIKGKDINKNLLYLKTGIILIFISYLLIKTNFFIADMQINKFPPNFIFILYTFAVLLLLYCLRFYIFRLVNLICKISVFNLIFLQYKNHTYTIYFTHLFCLYIINYILKNYFSFITNEYVIACIILFTLIPFAALMGNIFGFIEKIKLKPYNKI